jgi:hypothetical protein
MTMVAVAYEDGRAAYIRVASRTAKLGSVALMKAAQEHQSNGKIPAGLIVAVKAAR